MRQLIAAAMVGLVMPLAGSAQVQMPEPVERVTLDEAVERALRANPQVVQAETSLQTAEYGTRQAYASMLPTLSVSTGASLSSSTRFDPATNIQVTGQSDSYNAGLSTGMDLFAGGRNLAAVRSAQASVTAAEATLVTRRFAVALTAKRGFFAVLRAEELIRLSEERISQAEGNLSAAERRLQAGRATRSDVLRAELQMRNARQSLLDAQTQRLTAMYALGHITGIAGPVAAEPVETLAPQPLALTADRMRQIVLAEAPAVVSAEASLDVAESGLRAARAQFFPSLSVRGGYNWNNAQLGIQDGRTSWNTSLSLSYPLFNGLAREAAVDRATAQLTVAAAQSADVTRAALSEFERLNAALNLAAVRVVTLAETVEVAREDYRVQQVRYENGSSTILELVTSQIALIQAENDLINARYDYQIAKAELESLVGREL